MVKTLFIFVLNKITLATVNVDPLLLHLSWNYLAPNPSLVPWYSNSRLQNLGFIFIINSINNYRSS